MAAALDASPAAVIGANCCGGERAAIDVLSRLAPLTKKPISIFPNRGLADFDDLGRPVYIEGADYFARSARRLADLGANLVGGCCGTMPEDIHALKALASGLKPAQRGPIARVAPAHARPAEGRASFPRQATLE
jgi:homocysteine S-methyltransferase